MSKTGQARVLTPEQFARLLSAIKEHRYPEKNTGVRRQLSWPVQRRLSWPVDGEPMLSAS